MKIAPRKTAIVNYNCGSTNPIKNALAQLNVTSVYTSDPAEVLRCDRIILPNIRHFALELLSTSPYDAQEIEAEMTYVAKKLAITPQGLRAITQLPPKWYFDTRIIPGCLGSSTISTATLQAKRSLRTSETETQ